MQVIAASDSSLLVVFGDIISPELNDRVPVRLLREGDLEKVAPEILGAVRAFLAGG